MYKERSKGAKSPVKYDIYEAAREINRRSVILKEKKKQRKYVVWYSTSSAVVFAMLVAVLHGLGVFGPSELDDSVFGSFLLSREAGGYVLVGVICFVIAVAVTFYCVKHTDKNKNNSVDNDPADDH